MTLKKLLTYAGIGLAVYALIVQPAQAGRIVNGVFQTLRGAGASIMTFIQAVFG